MSLSSPTTTRRSFVLVCIMLSLFMSAIEVTIVATALPQIVGKLGGFTLYSWVFAGFLLTQTATTVIFGKLSDIYGRRPVIIAGTLAFLVASTLCGFAWSMGSLIAFRLLQGLGAGAMQPIAVTIAGDIYSTQERLKIQAWLSAVWATAAIAGPLAGGLIVEKLSWSWIFWVNIPVGIFTIAGFVFFLHENVAHKAHKIDYPGAALFSLAVGTFMVALTESATLTDMEIAALLAAAFVSALLFLMVERRAAEPMIALDVWGSKLIATTNAALMCGMMALAGVTSFMPLYFQSVLGYSAVLAGFPLSVMLFSWPLASAFAGRIIRVISTRRALRLGGMLIAAGSVFLVFITPDTGIVMAGVGPALMGFGMGLFNITAVIMIQGSVEWSKRGAATSALIFSRTLGNTVGVAALGTILNLGVIFYAARGAGAASPEQIRVLLTSIGDIAGGGTDPKLSGLLDHALHLDFWGMVIFGALAAAFALMVPVRELDSLDQHAGKATVDAEL